MKAQLQFWESAGRRPKDKYIFKKQALIQTGKWSIIIIP